MTRYFGSPVEASLITAGVPLHDGRIDAGTLGECATRAGLNTTPSSKGVAEVKAAMLPALMVFVIVGSWVFIVYLLWGWRQKLIELC